jgi:hypothetical protein
VRQPPAKNVSGEICAALAAQRAAGNNPRVRHRPHWSGNAFRAPFAPNYEIAKPVIRQIEHRASIGEQKAKKSTKEDLIASL